MRITSDVLKQIRLTIGCLPAETGGMLGGDARTGVITHFYFDGTAARTAVTYSPDTERINLVLARAWNPHGVDLLGFVHSHPHGFLQPSSGDLVYARAILSANPGKREVLLPIVSSRTDSGAFELRPFAAHAEGADLQVSSLRLDIVNGCKIDIRANLFASLPMFERVRTAYDLSRMDNSRLVAVGCGGAAGFIEDLARAGVGEFVLIDPDIVTETNLATQQTYRSDIRRPKVDALAERIRNINPLAFVVACQRRLDDLSDVEFCWLAHTAFRESTPLTTLLCGMTDDFYAQARVNRLALNFGLPSLCAQVYAEGKGAEVTFTHPDVTRACHRCILRSRYRAYLEEDFVNDVGSAGTPIVSTSRLNALKQYVALALLHHGTTHPRWGGLLTRIGDRNLVQLRLDPDLTLPGILKAFESADPVRLFCDEAIWLPQRPADMTAGCPDCGRRGDLRLSLGTLPNSTLRQ